MKIDECPGHPPSSGEGSASSRGLVLVADDTADTRGLYCLYLTHRGFRVLTAGDGEAAVELAVRHRPDVIVMDLAMPRLDGMAASHRLKSDLRTRYTPIILLTANPLKAVQRGALDQGVDEFLTKPCLPEDLERHVQRLISRPTREAV